jgi:hypothetical protein
MHFSRDVPNTLLEIQHAPRHSGSAGKAGRLLDIPHEIRKCRAKKHGAPARPHPAHGFQTHFAVFRGIS